MFNCLIVLFILAINYTAGDGFVEEVSCAADAINVVLNKLDADIQKWITDPKAQPVVYILGNKDHSPCGTAMKKGNSVNYNFTIPYGRHCGVILTDLEPNYHNAETTIALEDNADTSLTKTIRVNHVFCLYTRSVRTIRFNDISSGHEVAASTGGKPKPKVDMIFRSVDGRPLRAAKFGDVVEFYVALSPDKAYHGISPKECMFSDREDMSSPEARHLTFVQNSCPVDEMSEIIDPLSNVNEEVYFSKFKTFRFGNQSTVFAHCTVQVCLTNAECMQSCFKRVANSNLTAERLRFRHRRSVNSNSPIDKNDLVNEVAITKLLTILDDSESTEVTGRTIEECSLEKSATSNFIIFLLLALSCILFLLSTVICMVARRSLKMKFNDTKSDIYGISTPVATFFPHAPTPALNSLSMPNCHRSNPSWINMIAGDFDYPYSR